VWNPNPAIAITSDLAGKAMNHPLDYDPYAGWWMNVKAVRHFSIPI